MKGARTVAGKSVADEGVVPACRFRRPRIRQMQFVYFIVFRAGRRITFGITMCAFAVKTSVKSTRIVAGEGVVAACRFRRPTVRQVQFVYFIVFGSRRRITFGVMDHAPTGKRKRGAVSINYRRY